MLIEKVLRTVGLPMIGSVLCLSMCGRAYAKDLRLDIPDLYEKGSIYVQMRSNDTGAPVAGGTMTLFTVGRYVWYDNMYRFLVNSEFTEDIYDHYIDPEIIDDELAWQLLEYAGENDIKGETKNIDKDGRVSFSELLPGLYLLAQSEPPEGYYGINPFFVTLPLMNATTGVYDYDVDASPKTRPYNTAIPAPTLPVPEESEPSEPAPAEPEESASAPSETSPDPIAPGPSPAEPAPSESGPDAATPSDAKPDDGGASDSFYTARHRGNGSGGGSVSNTPAGGETIVIGDDVWEIVPIPETGERRNLLIASGIFAMAGIALAVVVFVRHRVKKK